MTLADVQFPPEKRYTDGQLHSEAHLAAWKRFGHI